MNYDIIRKNLEKLDSAIKTFPDILGKYKKSIGLITPNPTNTERATIRAYAANLNLTEYTNFIDWVDKISANGERPIYDIQISYTTLKSTILTSCLDSEVTDFIKKKTKAGFTSFLNSKLYASYNGGSRGRGRTKKYYCKNFAKCESLIANYIIQNDLLIEKKPYEYIEVIPRWYTHEIANFESELNTELEITSDITKSILKKIDTLKYDFRKINFNLLRTEIENKIRERVLSVTSGEQVKCIEESTHLTLNQLYTVKSYQIGTNGNLLVYVLNDNNSLWQYNYRLFETISKLREDNINSILNFL
jgi:hypothetical protein